MGELREQVGNTNDAVKLMIGICDFSYGPYVLGAALTWKMNLNVLASATGCGAIDQHRITNPAGPESRYHRFVNQHNCVSLIHKLFPDFLCGLRRQAERCIHYSPSFGQILRVAVRRRLMLLPPFFCHTSKRLDSSSHRPHGRMRRVRLA